MYANSLLGVWPFIFENHPTLRTFYDIYSKCTYYYFLLFIITAIIKLFILICDEVLDLDELVANLCITLLYSVTLLRVRAIKTDTVKNIIRKVIDWENRILNSENHEIIKLYNSYVMKSQVSNKIFLVNIFIVTALYFIHPLYVDDTIKYYPSRNETVVLKPLPLSSWFPFDEQQHYLLVYLWHILDGSVGASFVTYTDIFAFSLIIFPVGQIRILKVMLADFQRYVWIVKNQLQCSRGEASFVTLRECVLRHKEIIQYVNGYNKAMRNIMVLDFLQSSLQLASIVLRLLVMDITTLNVVYCGQFALSMFIRLLVYYWYANEIMEHSSEIGVALCSSMWYEEPKEVQKLMVIMMLRCNKKLCLEIGPFSVMTLSTFLGVNFGKNFVCRLHIAATAMEISTARGRSVLTSIDTPPTAIQDRAPDRERRSSN